MRNSSRCLIAPGLVNMAAQGRESLGLGNCGARDSKRLLDESFDDLAAEARELVLHRASLGLKALEIRQSLEDAGDNRPEERLLPREVSIDRRFACRRHLRDLIEAGALIALLEEHPLSRIEDPRFDVARQVFARPSLARPSLARPFRIAVFAHHLLFTLAFTMLRATNLADNPGLTCSRSKRK